MTIFHENEKLRWINAKINRLLKKIYFNISAKFEAIGAVSIELSRKQKSTTYVHKHTHTRSHTHAHTHIHTFPADDFFFNVDHICAKKVEI